MDLTTRYLGFDLPHPLIPGASPMTANLDTVRRLADAGAPMIVMHSLFEEQISAEEVNTVRSMEAADESYAEALSYLPRPEAFRLGPDAYLEQIRKIKQAVGLPVVGSLNGTTVGGWLEYAKLIQQAGADALELNLYQVALDFAETGQQVEERRLAITRTVKASVSVPVAVKLSPYYSSFSNYASRMDQTGADALVLFNRFYQPDIDVEALEVLRVNLSSSAELLPRIRWLAALSGKVKAALCCTGGVHTAIDAIKAIMAGAHTVQLVSALLHNGPAYLQQVRDDLEKWMEEHEYESLRQMQGSMSLMRCPDPKVFERANYLHILQSWRD